ncbi:MAG: hypothetical protein ACYC7E_13910 [Armatimonadota bacterium]
MFTRSLLGLCVVLAFSSIAIAAESPLSEPIVRKYELKHVSMKQAIQILTTPYYSGGFKEFLPTGIQEIVGLIGINALLVRAKDEQALDAFGRIVAVLDTPVKRIDLSITIVRLNFEDAKVLLAQMKPGIIPVSSGKNAVKIQYSSSPPVRERPALVMHTSAWDKAIKQLTDDKKLTQVGTARYLLTAGKPSVIDAREWGIPYGAFLLTNIDSKDDFVQWKHEAVLPIPIVPITNMSPSYERRLVTKEGETALLYSSLTDQSQSEVLVFASLRTLKEESLYDEAEKKPCCLPPLL